MSKAIPAEQATPAEQAAPVKLITRAQICAKTGIKWDRSQFWRMEKEGKFPRHVKLGERSIYWVESEIEAFISAKLADRPHQATA